MHPADTAGLDRDKVETDTDNTSVRMDNTVPPPVRRVPVRPQATVQPQTPPKLTDAPGISGASVTFGGVCVGKAGTGGQEMTTGAERGSAAGRSSRRRWCLSAMRHFSTSSSTQSKVLVTAFFQLRYRRSRSAGAAFGSHRLSSAQLAMTSASPCQ